MRRTFRFLRVGRRSHRGSSRGFNGRSSLLRRDLAFRATPVLDIAALGSAFFLPNPVGAKTNSAFHRVRHDLPFNWLASGIFHRVPSRHSGMLAGNSSLLVDATISGMIMVLFRLDIFRVQPSLLRMLGLISVRQNRIFLESIVVEHRSRARRITFSLSAFTDMFLACTGHHSSFQDRCGELPHFTP